MCEAYPSITPLIYLALTVVGLLYIFLAYRFLHVALIAMGFFTGVSLGYPMALAALYQAAPDDEWPFWASVTAAVFAGGLLAYLLQRIVRLGHAVIGFCAGGIMGYLVFVVVIVLDREYGIDPAIAQNYSLVFWCTFSLFALGFALISHKSKRHFFCFATSLMGAFLLVGGLAHFVTSYADSTLHFPDLISNFCTCLPSESECDRAPYGCMWAPPEKALENLAVRAPSCQRASPGALATVNLRDALYLAIMTAITLLSAPFQYYITGHMCEGSEHHQNELHEEVSLRCSVTVHPWQHDLASAKLPLFLALLCVMCSGIGRI
jgi:hypothetical protein